MPVVVRIQAHPSREFLWSNLIESLRPLPVEISVHSSDPPSPWDGYKQALRSLFDDPNEPTHGLILQEDIVTCRNFPLAIEQIAQAKLHEPVCLFLSWLPRAIAVDALQALKKNERYVRTRPAKFCPVVAILWPMEAAKRFLEWSESGVRLPGYPDSVRSDDAVLGEWIRRKRETVWIAMPNLVEHPDSVASVKGRRNEMWGKDRGRVALSFIGERDPLELDWSV